MKAGSAPTHISEVKRAKSLCLSIHKTMLYSVTSSQEFNLYSFQKLKKPPTLLNEGTVIIYYGKTEHTTEPPF